MTDYMRAEIELDNEIDRALRSIRVDPAAIITGPDIPILEAIEVCKRIGAEIDALDCECERIGVKKCGMCE